MAASRTVMSAALGAMMTAVVPLTSRWWEERCYAADGLLMYVVVVWLILVAHDNEFFQRGLIGLRYHMLLHLPWEWRQTVG